MVSRRFLLDSDVIIDHLRGVGAARDFLDMLMLDEAEVYFSTITEAEIFSNVRPGEEESIESLFGSMIRLPVDMHVARQGGWYRQRFRASHGLLLPDALIAATARVYDATLVTRNVRHYPMEEITVLEPYRLQAT